MVDAKPILKWAGGKWKLCPVYAEAGLFPKKIDRFFEPFLGGASVFLYLKPKDAVLTDMNEELINTYRTVRDDLDNLIGLIKKHKANHCKDYYYEVRSEWDEGSRTEQAARLIYLNKTCFNGLYRVNRSGKFNVPMGDYKNPTILNEENLRLFSKAIGKAELDVRDYQHVVEEAEKGDFIYFDPPYHPLSTTSSFTSYTSGGFTLKNQRELKETVDKLTEKGCLVLQSNSSASEIVDLYEKDYILTPITANRSISAKTKSRKPIKELAITNYEPYSV